MIIYPPAQNSAKYTQNGFWHAVFCALVHQMEDCLSTVPITDGSSPLPGDGLCSGKAPLPCPGQGMRRCRLSPGAPANAQRPADCSAGRRLSFYAVSVSVKLSSNNYVEALCIAPGRTAGCTVNSVSTCRL